MKLTILASAALLIIAAPSLSIVACSGAKSPQSIARDVIADVAEALEVADKACAAVISSHDVRNETAMAIGQRCVKGYRLAYNALIGAEEAAKAWQSGVEKRLTCAGAHALEGLAAVVAAVREGGVDVSSSVVRGIDGARVLATLTQGVSCER